MASVRDRGNGHYQLVFTYGKNPDGRPKQYTSTYKDPSGISSLEAKKKAKAIADAWERSIKSGNNFSPNLTLNELYHLYLENGLYKRNGKPLAESTIATYKNQYKNHIAGPFGDQKAISITNIQINNYIDLIRDELSCGSRKKIITTIGAIYTFAVSKGYLKSSPVKNIVNPSDDEDIDEQWSMSANETKEYIAFVQNSNADEDVKRILHFLCLTGLRIGECLGLSWKDIDFEKRTICVNHTLTSTNGLHLTAPKSKRSRRKISIGDTAIKILKAQKEYDETLKMSLGSAIAQPETVFPSAKGNYRDRHSVYVSLKRIVNGTKYEFMTLHKLRHIFATIMLNSGVDIATVSAVLGHSNIEITAKTYAEVLEGLKIAAAESVEKALKI